MTNPIIVMRALRVRDRHGATNGIDLALPAGPIGALIGAPADGGPALVEALAGQIRPHGGSVKIDGRDPATTPGLRRSIGALLHEHPLPNIGKVKELLAFTNAIRRGEAPRETWFEPLGISDLDPRPIASLTYTEARRLALAIALAVPTPIAIILCDPLAATEVSPETLRPILNQRAANGACVLIVTPSTADAVALADDVATLEQGRVVRPVGHPDVDQLVPGCPVELRVWCDSPRALASALVREPAISSMLMTLDSDSGSSNGLLQIRSMDAVACSKAVAKVAVGSGITVRAMQHAVPSTDEVNAATTRLSHKGPSAQHTPVRPAGEVLGRNILANRASAAGHP